MDRTLKSEIGGGLSIRGAWSSQGRFRQSSGGADLLRFPAHSADTLGARLNPTFQTHFLEWRRGLRQIVVLIALGITAAGYGCGSSGSGSTGRDGSTGSGGSTGNGGSTGTGGSGGRTGSGGSTSNGGTTGAGDSDGGTPSCGTRTDPNSGDGCNTVATTGPCVTETLNTAVTWTIRAGRPW